MTYMMQYKNKHKKHRSRGWYYLAAIGVFLLLIFGSIKLGQHIWQSWGQGLSFNFTKTAAEADYNPFAGSSNYPVAVMIDNSPEARPYHAGLFDALVVYETLAEGGSTRLEAVFAGAPAAERVGPVRSARPYFVQVAAGWGAFYWHAGGSPEGLALIKKLVRQNEFINLNEISGYGPIYLWREKSVGAPHNLFTSGEKIAKALADFELTALPEAKLIWRWEKNGDDKAAKKQAEKAAGLANNIQVIFSPGLVFNPSYIYDAEKKAYQRSLAKKSHQDYNTKEQLAASNVIIQKVSAEVALASGYDRIDFNIIGEGEAIYFRDGQVFNGRWKKASTASQTEWFLNDRPYVLKQGQTWVEIVPGEREVSYN